MNRVIECDAAELRRRAGPWLANDPVLNNVICTVVDRAILETDAFPDACWFVIEDGGQSVGAAMLTPPFPLAVSPMSDEVCGALVEALVGRLPRLPGVSGESVTAQRFVDAWGRRTGATARVRMTQRIYRLDQVNPPQPAPGYLRRACDIDRDLLVEWFEAFVAETGAVNSGAAAAVDRGLARQSLHVWEDGEPVTLVAAQPSVAGVVRIGPVYSPQEARRRGYASNSVAALSQQVLDAGASACMLYTDLANPTSNAIYQRIGYRPVADAVEFEFQSSGQPPT